MSETLYRVSAIGFSYSGSLQVLRGVDLLLGSGELVVLIGPNGSGKSTLLKLMAGIHRPQSGTIEFLGKPLSSYPPRMLAKQVAYLPQEDEIYFPFTVSEVVMLGRWPHSGGVFFDRQTDVDAAERAMEMVGIKGLCSRRVTELSGGERARVMLARALATEPRCLLLDEPASELDLRHRAEAYSLLRGLSDDGLGVLIVAHEIGAAARWADRVVVLAEGKVVADGKPDDVLTSGPLETAYGIGVKVVVDGPDRAVFGVIGGEGRK